MIYSLEIQGKSYFHRLLSINGRYLNFFPDLVPEQTFIRGVTNSNILYFVTLSAPLGMIFKHLM